ncbi:MAG: FAD-binding oxidoreductase [Acidimicrobiia bacterium]
MTGLGSEVRKALGSAVVEAPPGAPDAELVVAPQDIEVTARALDLASEHGLQVLVWGGGTHQGLGYRVEPDLVMVTTRMDRVVDWRPDDLTVVVEAGLRVSDLEERLAARGQTALLPERPGEATVGGCLAAGVSGWRRLRFGPTRDRVLEVVLATGDGRVVSGGGQVVKNVTGYDLPRLTTGSFGALGVIGRVCLKLWPAGGAAATVTVPDAEEAMRVVYRPLAVVEEDGRAGVYLAGTDAEVASQAAALGGEIESGLHWPHPLDTPVELVVRTRPSETREAVESLDGWRYQAAFGVGEVRVGAEELDIEAAAELRRWIEARGGSLVVWRAPAEVYQAFDPWGAPPAGVELQRRVKAAFDPLRVVNPGRLPGGI